MSEKLRISCLRPCLYLVCVLGLLASLQVMPAHHWAGSVGVHGVVWAGLVSLLPGLVVFWLAARYAASRGVIVVLAGTSLRVVAVPVAVMVWKFYVTEMEWYVFIVCLLVDYFACLVLETFLLMRMLKPLVDLPKGASRVESVRG